MYTPHAVTVYNVTTETDPATFEDKIVNHITILRGVFLDASKGTNVRESGLEDADAVVLHIPFSVTAVDGVTGAEKRYVGPMEFWRAADKSGIWTLSVDRNTFFVKGEVVENDSDPKKRTEEYINLAHDGVYTVTKVDEKDFGSPAMQHWEVGGV